MGPCFPGDEEHLPVHGECWMNSLFHFACVNSLCFPYWTALTSTPTSFSRTFTLLIISLILLWREWASSWAVLSCWVGIKSQHCTELISSGIEACRNARSCTCVQIITEASDRWADAEESLPQNLLCCGSCAQISKLYTEKGREEEAVLGIVV